MSDFAWPICIAGGVVVATFLGIFRTQIAALLDRTTKISKDGLQTAQALQPQLDQPAPLQQALDNTSALVRQEEERVRTYVRDSKIERPEEQVSLLTRHLAILGILLEFERLNFNIFGSQLYALHDANTFPDGLPLSRFHDLYDGAAKAYPATYDGYTFEQWCDFMVRQSLVTIDADRATITQKGREFMAFLIHSGRTYIGRPN